MRRYFAAVLSATALVACVDASKMNAADVPASVGLFDATQDRVFAKRLLRTHETANEERAFEKIAGLVRASTSKANELLSAAKLKKYESMVSKLQLGDDFAATLKSSQLEKLSKFVTKFNKASSSQISFIGKLTAKYGDDVVARTVVEAERDAETPALASLAKQLKDDQVAAWLKKDDSVLDVFNLLKLGDDGYRALRSRELGMLEDYIAKYNMAKSGEESLLKTLTASLGGDEGKLVSMLAQAKNHPRSVTKAKELETGLLTKWQNDKMSAMSVWSRLKFGDSADDALSSGKVRVFFKFISQNYASTDLVLEQLTVKYGEAAVATALVSARGQMSTADVATTLQRQQLNSWLTREKSADDVLALLKIKDDGALTQKLDTLDEYIKLLKSKNPQDGTNTYTVLRNAFDEEDKFALMISKALQTADSTAMKSTMTYYQEILFKRWVETDLDPMSVLVNVFKVPESNVGAVRPEIDWIVKQYTRFYSGVVDVNFIPAVLPRRF